MTLPLHQRCRDGIVTDLKSRVQTGLKGIEQDNILGQFVFDDTDMMTPAIVCSIEDEAEQLLGGNTTHKRIRYPVRVYLVDTERLVPEDTAKYAGWRDAMLQPWHQRPRPYTAGYGDNPGVFGDLLSGVPEAQDTQVAPLPVIQMQDAKYHRVVSGCRVNVECLVER